MPKILTFRVTPVAIANSPQNGEDDEAGQETGQAVDAARDEGIPIAIVVKFVVAGEG